MMPRVRNESQLLLYLARRPAGSPCRPSQFSALHFACLPLLTPLARAHAPSSSLFLPQVPPRRRPPPARDARPLPARGLRPRGHGRRAGDARGDARRGRGHPPLSLPPPSLRPRCPQRSRRSRPLGPPLPRVALGPPSPPRLRRSPRGAVGSVSLREGVRPAVGGHPRRRPGVLSRTGRGGRRARVSRSSDGDGTGRPAGGERGGVRGVRQSHGLSDGAAEGAPEHGRSIRRDLSGEAIRLLRGRRVGECRRSVEDLSSTVSGDRLQVPFQSLRWFSGGGGFVQARRGPIVAAGLRGLSSLEPSALRSENGAEAFFARSTDVGCEI
ncbi:hypothetical protein ACHAWF_002789 [Thalassiosira exigua]